MEIEGDLLKVRVKFDDFFLVSLGHLGFVDSIVGKGDEEGLLVLGVERQG